MNIFNALLLPVKYTIKTLKLLKEYLGDMVSYMQYNNYSPLVDKKVRNRYKLIINAHKIEKGLSLLMPRVLFGKEAIAEIHQLDQAFGNEFSMERAMAKGALTEYAKKFPENLEKETVLKAMVMQIASTDVPIELQDHFGGLSTVDKDDFISAEIAEKFLKSRHSARAFDRRPVPRTVIEKTIDISKFAPSQCNRQSIRVHVYQDYEVVQKLLDLQGGARGFSEEVGNLFIVTSDLTAWQGPQQRNQCYVDGGLQAMMLLLACHAIGLNACPLNLAVKNSTERDIRNFGNIPPNHRLIMFIAFGYENEEWHCKVAKSPRRATTEVANFH